MQNLYMLSLYQVIFVMIVKALCFNFGFHMFIIIIK